MAEEAKAREEEAVAEETEAEEATARILEEVAVEVVAEEATRPVMVVIWVGGAGEAVVAEHGAEARARVVARAESNSSSARPKM